MQEKKESSANTVLALLLSFKTIYWPTLTSAKINALRNSLSSFQFRRKLEVHNGKIGQANSSCKDRKDHFQMTSDDGGCIGRPTQRNGGNLCGPKQSLGNWIFMQIIPFVLWQLVTWVKTIYSLFEDSCTESDKIIRPFYQPFQVTLAFTLVLPFTCCNFWVLLSASASSW